MDRGVYMYLDRLDIRELFRLYVSRGASDGDGKDLCHGMLARGREGLFGEGLLRRVDGCRIFYRCVHVIERVRRRASSVSVYIQGSRR